MKISIIVPIYKVPEEYLKKCISSLINQTYNNVEILLIDDGSPDLCGEICDRFASNDHRIKVIHKRNGGLASARNRGVLEATGEYVVFVDADDWIEQDTCRILAEKISKDRCDVFMFGMVKEYNNTHSRYKYNLIDNHIYQFDEISFLQQQVLEYNSNIATATTKAIRRKILIDENIMHVERLKQGAEGIVFNLMLFEKIRTAMFIPDYLYHYTYNNQSISTTHDEKNHMLVVKCFEVIKDYIISINKEYLLDYYYNRLIYVVVTTAISGYFSPTNDEPYAIKKNKYINFLEQPIIKEALLAGKYDGIGIQRKIIVYLIRSKCFAMVSIIAKMRNMQKNHLF